MHFAFCALLNFLKNIFFPDLSHSLLFADVFFEFIKDLPHFSHF